MINLAKLEEVAKALVPLHRKEMRCLHVAGIYRKGKMIALGWNKDLTHPKVLEYKYFKGAGLHAELATILKGGREEYSDYDIAVCRIDMNDQLNYSKPCASCTNVIKQLDFKNCYFSEKDGSWSVYKPKESIVIKNCNRY